MEITTQRFLHHASAISDSRSVNFSGCHKSSVQLIDSATVFQFHPHSINGIVDLRRTEELTLYAARTSPNRYSNRASTTRQLNSATASAGRSFYSKQFIALCWLGTGTAINQTQSRSPSPSLHQASTNDD